MSRWASVTPEGELVFHDDEPTLDRLQEEVGGPIEALPSPEDDLGVSVMINEEKHGALNAKASNWLRDVLFPGQRVVGTLLVGGAGNDDGTLDDLTLDQSLRLSEVFG